MYLLVSIVTYVQYCIICFHSNICTIMHYFICFHNNICTKCIILLVSMVTYIQQYMCLFYECCFNNLGTMMRTLSWFMNLHLKCPFLWLILALLLLQGNTFLMCDLSLLSLSVSLSLNRGRAIEESSPPPPPLVPRASRAGSQPKTPLPQLPLPPPIRKMPSENDRFTQSTPVNAMRPVHMRPKVRNTGLLASVITFTWSLY